MNVVSELLNQRVKPWTHLSSQALISQMHTYVTFRTVHGHSGIHSKAAAWCRLPLWNNRLTSNCLPKPVKCICCALLPDAALGRCSTITWQDNFVRLQVFFAIGGSIVSNLYVNTLHLPCAACWLYILSRAFSAKLANRSIMARWCLRDSASSSSAAALRLAAWAFIPPRILVLLPRPSPGLRSMWVFQA